MKNPRISLATSLAFASFGLIAVPSLIAQDLAGPSPYDRSVMTYIDPSIAEMLGIAVTNGKTKQMAPTIPNLSELPATYVGSGFETFEDVQEQFGKIDEEDEMTRLVTPRTVVYILTAESALKMGLIDKMIDDMNVYIVAQGVSADTIGEIFKKEAISNLTRRSLASFFASDTFRLDDVDDALGKKVLPAIAAGALAKDPQLNSRERRT